MKRQMLVGAVVLMLAAAARAEVVIPLVVPVSPEDEKAVRLMLGEYVKAVVAGDRAEALAFCQIERKDDEKLVKLGCEIDFAIRRLRLIVEKKLSKDAWGKTGEKLGEMTVEAMKTIEVHPTASGDEVRVVWNETSKVPAEKRLSGGVSIRRTKEGWRFALASEGPADLRTRRWLRDCIGEIEYLADEIEQGKLKAKEPFDKAVDQLIKEANTPDSSTIQNGEGEMRVPENEAVPENAPPEIIEQQ